MTESEGDIMVREVRVPTCRICRMIKSKGKWIYLTDEIRRLIKEMRLQREMVICSDCQENYKKVR